MIGLAVFTPLVSCITAPHIGTVVNCSASCDKGGEAKEEGQRRRGKGGGAKEEGQGRSGKEGGVTWIDSNVYSITKDVLAISTPSLVQCVMSGPQVTRNCMTAVKDIHCSPMYRPDTTPRYSKHLECL